MSMKAEELISRKCHNIESKSLSGHLVVIDKVAFEAIEMARQEEREKAIEAFKELQCYCGKDMDCYFCSCRCNLSKFRKIINQ